jgi:hypothetical protein
LGVGLAEELFGGDGRDVAARPSLDHLAAQRIELTIPPHDLKRPFLVLALDQIGGVFLNTSSLGDGLLNMYLNLEYWLGLPRSSPPHPSP